MTYDPSVEPGVAPREGVVGVVDDETRRRWRPVAFATAGVFALNALVIGSWVSRLPATRDRLDLDARSIGITLLMMGLGSLAAMPFVSRVAARRSSRPVVLGAATLSGIALVTLAVTPNAVTTGAVLFVLGAAYGCWDVAMNIQGSYVDRQAGRDYMPRYHACWSVGVAVGAALGALAASLEVSLLVHFAVAALISAGGSIVVAMRWYVDDREPVAVVEASDDGTDVDPVQPRLLSRRLVLIGVITLCACLCEGAASDWTALYLTDERGAAASLAALGYGAWATAMAAMRFSGTTIIGRLGRSTAIRLAGAVLLVGVVATLAAPGIVGSFVGIVAWGAGVALVFPAAMSAGGETPGRAAAGIAVVSTIGYGGFLVGPPLIGLLAHEIGLGRALWVLPFMAALILLLAPVVSPPRTTEPAGPVDA